MNDTNFQPIFDYIDRNTAEIKDEVKKIGERVDVLTTAVDSYLKQGEGYRQEVLAMRMTLDKHNRWFKLVEEKLGLKFEN